VAGARLPETRRGSRTRIASSQRSALSAPVARLVTVGFGAITAFAAFEATFALLASTRLDADESTVAWVFAAVGMVLVIAQGGLVGPMSRQLGESNVIRLGQVLDLIGFLIIAVSSSWLLLLGGLMFLALGQGLLTPALSSALAGMTGPQDAGLALGFQQAAGGLARVLGPLLGGLLFAIDAPIPYLAAAAISVIVLPVVPSITRPASTSSPVASESVA